LFKESVEYGHQLNRSLGQPSVLLALGRRVSEINPTSKCFDGESENVACFDTLVPMWIRPYPAVGRSLLLPLINTHASSMAESVGHGNLFASQAPIGALEAVEAIFETLCSLG
jgi:hypothetical protein